MDIDFGIRYCRACGKPFGPCWDNREYCSEGCEGASKPLPPFLKVNPRALPKPLLEPTRAVRIGEVVSASEAAHLSAEIGEWKKDNKAFRESARRGLEISTKARRINQWTPEKDEELLRLRAAGKSYSEIVEITGRTLSAVEHRLGLLKKQGRYSADWKRKGGKS